MQTGTNRARSSAASRPDQYRIFRFELHTTGRLNLLPPRFHRRINRCVQRLSPAFPRLITHGGDHKQVPRAGCGDVRHARTLRLIAEQFLVFVLKQIGRRASG